MSRFGPFVGYLGQLRTPAYAPRPTCGHNSKLYLIRRSSGIKLPQLNGRALPRRRAGEPDFTCWIQSLLLYLYIHLVVLRDSCTPFAFKMEALGWLFSSHYNERPHHNNNTGQNYLKLVFNFLKESKLGVHILTKSTSIAIMLCSDLSLRGQGMAIYSLSLSLPLFHG